MRKWLAILLMSLMSIQISWATVSPYCQHESGAAARHFGHHDHEHRADADRGEQADPVKSGSFDPDCSFCHAGCLSAPPAALQLPAATADAAEALSLQLQPPTAPPARPERPKWSFLA